MKKCFLIAPLLLQVLAFPGQPPAQRTGVTGLEQLVLTGSFLEAGKLAAEVQAGPTADARTLAVCGVAYLKTRRIAEAEVYCSNDPKQWGEPVAKPTWPITDQLQTVAFRQPTRARFLKLVAKSEVNRNSFAAIAELDVMLTDR